MTTTAERRDPTPGDLRAESDGRLALFCRVGTTVCALPLEHVVETMRPLPVESLAGAPHVVRGVAIIRGAPVPVLDLARLLGGAPTTPTRFVTVAVGGRRVALAVGEVLGVRRLPSAAMQDLPPLLADVGAELVTAIGRLDAELLLALGSAQLVSDHLAGACDAPAGCP